MTNQEPTASENRQNHTIKVGVRELSDKEQEARKEAANRLNPGGSQ